MLEITDDKSKGKITKGLVNLSDIEKGKFTRRMVKLDNENLKTANGVIFEFNSV